MTRKVFIAIPAYDGTLRVHTAMSLINVMHDREVEIEVHGWSGDSLLPHARNVLLGQFMASGCTDLVFIDSDVSWQRGALEKLLAHPVDFVAGAYRFKNDIENYPVTPTSQRNGHGLMEAVAVPGGFFRMTRAGLERVVNQCGHLVYRPHTAQDVTCWYLFDIRLENGQAVGEDYAFCKTIRALGETIWLDPDLSLTHSGWKDYPGHFGTFCAEKARAALPEEEQKAHEAKLVAFAKSMLTPEMDLLFKQALGTA